MSHIAKQMATLGQNARTAYAVLSQATTAQKNAVLTRLAELITQNRSQIEQANAADCQAAEQNGLSAALLDRLKLSAKAIDTMIEGLHQVAALPDPVGQMTDFTVRPSGIQVGKMRVPLGVIGMIYEARPNVTIEAASLCLKTGNACILRGGSEAILCNHVLSGLIGQALRDNGLPEAGVQLIGDTDRAYVGAMLAAEDWIDVIIPRGGKSLVERVKAEARMSVIQHLDGICHLYIDQYADTAKAIPLAVNAKTSRYGACNSLETLLIHAERATEILPLLAEALLPHQVELRACARALPLLPHALAATDEDWSSEYLAPILSIKVVDSIEEAISHINHYGSHHTDSIVTESYTLARQFLRAIDSASVMVNASTRFADGFEYGLGAEIGISTAKIHARGPVGLEGLTSQKWIVLGDGQIRL